MAFTIKPGITVVMHNRVIGPSHDPYGALHIKINAGSIGHADLYTDGLGACVARFWSDFDDHNPARVIRWDGNDRRLDKQMALKVNIIARRTMDLRFDEVEAFYHNLPADPMGPASRYM